MSSWIWGSGWGVMIVTLRLCYLWKGHQIDQVPFTSLSPESRRKLRTWLDLVHFHHFTDGSTAFQKGSLELLNLTVSISRISYPTHALFSLLPIMHGHTNYHTMRVQILKSKRFSCFLLHLVWKSGQFYQDTFHD